MIVPRRSWRMDSHWWWQIWLQHMANVACNIARMAIEDYWIIIHELPLAKTINLENTPMNIVHSIRMVTLLHSSHFEALHRVVNILHSTWHIVRSLPPEQAKDFKLTRWRGKDMTSTTVAMVGLELSPICRLEEMNIVSMCTASGCWTASKQFSQSADILELYSSTWTFFRLTWKPPN